MVLGFEAWVCVCVCVRASDLEVWCGCDVWVGFGVRGNEGTNGCDVMGCDVINLRT